ncbi:MAG: roadblock/LC7 domain-containing protein [Candidatus Helarchaeota archaeon]
MSVSPQAILAKILRSSTAIKEVVICDKVGLIISKVLRMNPIEGLGAMESSIFKAAEEICEFLDLGKEIIHVSVFQKNSVIAMEIGLGYLVIVLDHESRFILDSELISSCLNDLINMWINELGLQGYDFSIVESVIKGLYKIYAGEYKTLHLYHEALDDFDVISATIEQVKNPLILAQCITNELGLPIAFQKQPIITVESDEFGGGLLSLDAIVKEKSEKTELYPPIFSMVLTNQDKGFMTVHGGTMDNEPLVYQVLFNSKNGFIEILSETASVINTISQEYGDQQTKSFLETLESFRQQLYPEEKPEVAPDTAGTEQVKVLMDELSKNITETTKYYDTQLNELLQLFATRTDELIQSLETYDKELRGWVAANKSVIKQFGFENRTNEELSRWDQIIEKLKSKIKHLRKSQ